MSETKDVWQKLLDQHQDGLNEVAALGITLGRKQERLRILEQWQYEMNNCKCEDAMGHMERRIQAELPTIEGLQK